jgi:glycosyl-4,4'-diaponeurosporenoate acyltransferase
MRAWESIGVMRWKDRLPEWGGVFGGVSKRHLPAGPARRERLASFAAESRRAELVHRLGPLPAPLVFLWHDPRVAAVITLGALASNLPCLAVARYNRGRVERMLSRPTAPR